MYILSPGPEHETDLMKDLHVVTNWYTLGLNLKVPSYILDGFWQDYKDTERCRNAVFTYWLKNTLEDKSWATIVHALCESTHVCLAKKVALEHGE